MRRVNTLSVPMPLSDDTEQKHALVLYRLAYRVATHAILRALVVSRDQSALDLFFRMGLRRAPNSTHTVDGHGADDKRTVPIDFGIAAHGRVLPPQIIFEGTTKRCLPENSDVYAAYRWLFSYSYNHWSSIALALKYANSIEDYLGFGTGFTN